MQAVEKEKELFDGGAPRWIVPGRIIQESHNIECIIMIVDSKAERGVGIGRGL